MKKINYKNILLIWFMVYVIDVTGLPAGNIANKYFLEKQKFLFEIVHKIQEPLQNEEWLNMGKNLVVDKTHYLEFTPLMEEFAFKANKSQLLALNEIFYLSDKNHLKELKALYYFLYNAQDFETLRENICWARKNVQPQMFVFALTQTLMKREDFKDLNLPKIYEIWPQHFFSDKYIRNLQHFNYIQWSRADMFKEDLNSSNKSLTTKACKIGQWWCKENLIYQIYQEKERMILPKNIYGDFRNSSKWLQALQDVSLYWLPVDFSREHAESKDVLERSVTYLIEDKTWNAYWYYMNMGLWLNEKGQNDLYSKSLRDWWFWNLQQIINRYKIEEISINMETHLETYLINFQNLKYETLNDNYLQHIKKFIYDLYQLTDKALYEQTFKLKNNTRIQLNNPEHFEYFLNENFNINKILDALMSLPHKESKPSLMQYFETMLRSKEFYYYAEQILNLYRSLKSNFEPYKLQDLHSNGIIINEVEVSELKTYFEITDTDVTNLLRSSDIYFEAKLLWFKSLLARQQQLQHENFKFIFNITSDKPQAVLVRTFLARDCLVPQDKAKCSSPLDFLQLDIFASTLATGYNIIERESKDFYGYMPDSLSYTELYHFTTLALNDEYDFPLNITLGNCRFPHHLKLPKGLVGKGLPVKLVYVVTTYNYRFHKAFNWDCDFSSGVMSFDDLPPGFPFDRDLKENIFRGDNIFIKKMRIYHNDTVHFRGN